MSDYIATRDAYGQALAELGRKDSRIVVFDADLSGSTKTSIFKSEFPERHFNAGIAEMNMAGMAAGMAVSGKIPFISTFAVFGTGRIYDMIRNSIAYPKLNVKLAMTHSGLSVGEDGASHQMLEDIALMCALPNMTVFVPADAEEARQMVFEAARIDGPVYIRLGREKAVPVFNEYYNFTPSDIHIVKDGSDVVLAACGIMTAKAIEAAERLKEDNISAAVLNFSSLKPVDAFNLIAYAKKTYAVITCEEHSVYGGLHSIVSQILAQNAPTIVEAVAVDDSFGESGKPEELLVKYSLTADEIIKKVKAALRKAL